MSLEIAQCIFNWPFGITTDGKDLYVTDSNNATILKVIIWLREK